MRKFIKITYVFFCSLGELGVLAVKKDFLQ